jgi:hypothetical protein
MVDERGIFYLYDSMEGNEAVNPIHAKEHRSLFANIAKRSKYFIVNPGLIDRPDIRGNQMEIGSRYFEGVAAGVIMIGETPNNGEFEYLFDWPGAVVALPFGSDRIGALINELEAQPEKLEGIRRMNVIQALTRHDWAYRWEKILENVGLEPMAELLQRKERLANLAGLVMPDGFASIGGMSSPPILP